MSGLPRPTEADAVLAQLGVAEPLPPREAALYLRYLRAIALLAECRPYVDECDYAALIDELLDDAQAHYPFDVHRDGERRSMTPRGG